MIKINLVKRKKKAGGGFTFTDLKSLDLAAVVDIFKGSGGGEEKKIDINGPLPKLIISLVVIYFVNGIIEDEKKGHLQNLDNQINAIEAEKTAAQAKLAQMSGYEATKKQLEDDEQSIRTKLDVVNTLLSNRNGPSRMMMQIAQVIPEEMWLTDFRVTNQVVRLQGATPGHSQVSDFIKSLNDTSQFSEISLSNIQESTSTAKDQRYQSFELEAKRRTVN